jgi:hypothetical protein
MLISETDSREGSIWVALGQVIQEVESWDKTREKEQIDRWLYLIQ